MRRWLVPLLTAGLILGSAAVATADDALEEMLETAMSADFHGRGVVLCAWGGDSAATTYEVSRHNGMSMVSGGGTEFLLGGGAVATRSGSDWYALEIEAWSDWDLSDRYSLSAASVVTRLGRPAREMLVLEQGNPRARVIVDAQTGAPLLTEVFDGSGATYRMAALIDFEATDGGAAMPPMDEMMELRSVQGTAGSDTLPVMAAWYRQADSYGGPGDALHAFFTDGLFSFSVFESRRGPTPEQFAAATRFVSGGKVYRRIVTPSQVWVQWHAPDHSYVLVGDLPPDHIAAVLRDLPLPGERSLFVRLWRRLFG